MSFCPQSEDCANMPADASPKAASGKQQQETSTEASLSSTPERRHAQMSTQCQHTTQEPQPSGGEESKSTFDEELEWCIAQLQLGILRKDASKTQKQENERHVRTLSSSKAPLPRKRQLMRSLFGDYRAKMKKQPLPQSLVKPQISSVEKETFEATGKFYKESASHNQPNLHACSVSSCDATKLVKDQLTHGDYSAEPFCFNFEIDPDS